MPVCFLMLTACTHMAMVTAPAETIESPSLGIGVRVVPVPYEFQDKGTSKGLKVETVLQGSSAQKSDLRVGDIIIEYDSNKMTNQPGKVILRSFRDHVKFEKQIGEKLHLKLLRETTEFSGQKNGGEIAVAGREGFDQLLANQPLGETLVISIEKKIVLLDIDTVLYRYPYFQRKNHIQNDRLFPGYEKLSDPFIPFFEGLIEDFNISDPYKDLLSRYSEDELRDDGFRLKLFQYLHRDPVKLPVIADNIMQSLEEHGKQWNLSGLIREMAILLDEDNGVTREPVQYPKSENPEIHFQFIKATVDSALVYRDLAFSALGEPEQLFLAAHIKDLVDGLIASSSGDSKDDESEMQTSFKMMQLAHDIDYTALLKSAEILAALTDRKWLAAFRTSLMGFHPEEPVLVKGVKGEVLYHDKCSAGQLVVGGHGVNWYDLDAAVIVDVGGNDFYANGAGAASRQCPISMVMDFNGDDQYGATAVISQGSGFLGVGILIDMQGDDIYTGTAFSQGTGLMGAGILVDEGGDDRYFSQELSQGLGFWGLGLLVDAGGRDRYQSHLLAQGVGGPKGVGVLLDVKGDDTYYATGKYQSSYGSNGVFSGLSQGFGFGLRGYTSGGIGALIDANGQDRFEAGNFSQGGGYFFGMGVLKNSGNGDDVYIGSRYGQGFSAHSALGILIDDGGDDWYSGQVGALQGAAWDKGAAALIDKKGDDLYDARMQFFSQAAAAHNGFSIFIDQSGTDQYFFQDENKIGGNHYHGGSSLSFFIDNGGDPDQYNGSLEKNNTITLSGEYGIMGDLDHDIRESDNGEFR